MSAPPRLNCDELPMQGIIVSLIGRRLAIAGLSLVVLFGVFRCLTTADGSNQWHDLAYLWLSGKAWASGISPYSADYVALGKSSLELAGVTERPYAFFYPPNWSVLTIPMGLLPYSVAGPSWVILNIILVIGSQIAIFFSLKPEKRSYLVLLAALAYCFALNGTRFNLVLGQTSILIMFALSLLMLGIARNIFWLKCLGVVLVMLKPNVGMVLVAPMILYDYRAVIVAGAASLAMCIPALMIETPISIIHRLSASIATYGDYPINSPQAQTGVSTLIYVSIGADVSAVALSLIAALIAAILFTLYMHIQREKDCVWFAYLWIASAMAAMMVRFHMHDMVIITLLIQPLLLFKMNHIARAGFILGLLLLIKPERLAIMLHFYSRDAALNLSNFLGANLLASLGMLAVTLALLAYLSQLWMNKLASGARSSEA
jgi:hypothetical protein